MVFHAVSWPLAPVLGDVEALKTVAVVAAGAVVLLVHPLARASGLGGPWPVVAQALCAVLPVLTSRLTLALFPTLFGLAFLTLLVVHLARRLGHLDGARDGAAALVFILLAEASYTGSLLMTSVLVLVLTAIELAAGEWRRAWRLLGGWAIATALLLVTMYVGFLPRLWSDVLPHLFTPAAAAEGPAPAGIWAPALTRLGLFYGIVFPLLTVLGLLAHRERPVHASRVLSSAVLAGTIVLLARYAWPAALRDAKEVELMAAPVAVLAAGALRTLVQGGRLERLAAVIVTVYGVAWAMARDVALYLERFTAIAR
jgi:hypothetical protein